MSARCPQHLASPLPSGPQTPPFSGPLSLPRQSNFTCRKFRSRAPPPHAGLPPPGAPGPAPPPRPAPGGEVGEEGPQVRRSPGSHFRPGEGGPTPRPPAPPPARLPPASPPDQVKRGPGCVGARGRAGSLRLQIGRGPLPGAARPCCPRALCPPRGGAGTGDAGRRRAGRARGGCGAPSSRLGPGDPTAAPAPRGQGWPRPPAADPPASAGPGGPQISVASAPGVAGLRLCTQIGACALPPERGGIFPPPGTAKGNRWWPASGGPGKEGCQPPARGRLGSCLGAR